jgi:hypothetical protein
MRIGKGSKNKELKRNRGKPLKKKVVIVSWLYACVNHKKT